MKGRPIFCREFRSEKFSEKQDYALLVLHNVFVDRKSTQKDMLQGQMGSAAWWMDNTKLVCR
jgi:hypothetical protein